jgi:Putative DNA-binding domain
MANIFLSDEDLLMRLGNFEDPFVERKTAADVNDVTKTAVAFANSLPVGAPGVIFIPVKNDGTIQAETDLDSLQKTITRRLNRAYPQIPSLYKNIRKAEKPLIAVIIWGSKDRPHFSGPAYVRKGSESVDASKQEFETLIAQRSSKVYEILKWKGKDIFVSVRQYNEGRVIHMRDDATVLDCNQFFVSIQMHQKGFWAIPLINVELSFHDQKNCLGFDVTA